MGGEGWGEGGRGREGGREEERFKDEFEKWRPPSPPLHNPPELSPELEILLKGSEDKPFFFLQLGQVSSPDQVAVSLCQF